jgi:murein DD-endopeptidase MepM/ murein hydrolase activator NlpD
MRKITKNKFLHTLNKHKGLLTMVFIPVASVICSHLTMAASPLWTETSYFGEVDSVHHIPHNGVDFAMPEGTRVDSIVDGTVIDVRHAGNRSWGTSVHIRDLQGREVIYGHLSQPEVEIGQMVHVGDEIALSGNTGHSFGSHLHIQININGKPINPMRDIIGAAIGRHQQ